jgi:hypothetical protein
MYCPTYRCHSDPSPTRSSLSLSLICCSALFCSTHQKDGRGRAKSKEATMPWNHGGHLGLLQISPLIPVPPPPPHTPRKQLRSRSMAMSSAALQPPASTHLFPDTTRRRRRAAYEALFRGKARHYQNTLMHRTAENRVMMDPTIERCYRSDGRK